MLCPCFRPKRVAFSCWKYLRVYGFHARSIQKGNENCYFGIIKGCSKLLLLRLLKGCTNPGQTNDKKIRKSCFRLPLLHVLGMNECQQNLAAF